MKKVKFVIKSKTKRRFIILKCITIAHEWAKKLTKHKVDTLLYKILINIFI